MPTIPGAESKLVRLEKWLVEDGAEVHAGTRLAILETTTGNFAVLTKGDGFLRERLFPAGAELQAGTPIATVDADGENIPYGSPYSIVERIESTREPST
jgi:pyruvate/2-oxoglutarate dehydrogenase complex dihydrolipoamide acyltransferase (E2) component